MRRKLILVLVAIVVVLWGSFPAFAVNNREAPSSAVVSGTLSEIRLQPKMPDWCNLVLAGPHYGYSNWLTGDEEYAAYQAPENYGCTNVYPFEVCEVTIILSTTQAVTLDLQPRIYNNGGTVQCPAPGDTICEGAVYSVSIPGAGGWIISLPCTCCVSAPYFACVDIKTTGLLNIVVPVTTQTPPQVLCYSYNDYGIGWVDMGGVGFNGYLCVWSAGYTEPQNDCPPPSCPEDPNDLGICDTLYVETFDCDHSYHATAGYDSVRVAIYVTHDSNTFWFDVGQRWVQDSIVGFVVPLKFWKEGCADSVVFPTYGNWNNQIMDSDSAKFKRSMFRHIVDAHTGDTVYNRFALMHKAGAADWSAYTDVVSHDPGHVFIALIPAPSCQSWWEGSKVLLATMTFLVHMAPSCSSTAICLDSTFWPPSNRLTFCRIDAESYTPRHFLPVTDSIYTGVKWIEGSTEEENKPTAFLLSQNYPNPFNPVTNFKFSLPQASHVKIEIFNIVGQRVKTLLDEDMKTGVFVVDWNGKDEKGVEVSSGIYFYRVIADDFSDIKKMVLLR